MTVSFSPPFPTNPQPGDTYCGWTWNGTQWICTQGQQVVIQTFLQSGTYMPSPGLIGLVVETLGGGGGGGGAQTTAVTLIRTGGGGGSGGYSRKALSAALVRGGVIVTIGAGGDQDSPGSATSFGALCIANGGLPGGPNDGVNGFGAAGFGAAVGVGDVVFPGATGLLGIAHVVSGTDSVGAGGGMGGQIFGGSGTYQLGPGEQGVGFPGYPNSGAGGQGGTINQVVGLATGGAGGSGVCVVTEYCFGDTSSTNGCCGTGAQGMARVAIGSGWAPPQGWSDND